VENLRKSPVFARFSFSEINNFASCLGVAWVSEKIKESLLVTSKWLCCCSESHDLCGYNSLATPGNTQQPSDRTRFLLLRATAAATARNLTIKEKSTMEKPNFALRLYENPKYGRTRGKGLRHQALYNGTI